MEFHIIPNFNYDYGISMLCFCLLFVHVICLFPSCSGEPSVDIKTSNKPATEKRKWEPFRHIRRRYRAGFSESISSLGNY